MKELYIHLILGLTLSLILVSCKTEPDPCPEPELVELRENFSEAEFENAIIGTWKSAFEWEDEVNVLFLKIDCENNVKINIEENGLIESYTGNLTVEYPRPTSPVRVTRVKMIISTKDKEIVLSDVGFGKNNMISSENLYLRNYKSPHATLEWEVD